MPTALLAATLAFTALMVAVALMARPGRALGVLVLSMLFWPEYMRVPMGLAQMSAPRIVALALLARFVVTGRFARVRYRPVDLIVFLLWPWNLAAFLLAGGGDKDLVTTIGRGLDTVLIYFVARVALLELKDYRKLVGPLVLGALWMAFFGVGEAVTSESPYQRLLSFHGWQWYDKAAEYRMGMLRARASMAHPIYFGMAMVLVTGMLYSLRRLARPRWKAQLAVPASLVAAASSLSSGPLVAIMLLVICNVFIYIPRMIKPFLVLCAFAAAFLEFASNRHFYSLIDYLAFNTGTGWYRTKLMEVAVAQVHEYWLVGVGSIWPHHWGKLVDGRNHVDVVNHFIMVALYGGLIGLGLYLASHVIALRDAIRAFRSTLDPSVRRLAFGLGASLLALDLASMSVGLFGPPLLLSFLLLGMTVDLTRRVADPNGVRYVAVPRVVRPASPLPSRTGP